MSSNWNNWKVIITATQNADYVLRTEDQGAPVVASGGEPIDLDKSRIITHRNENVFKIKEMTIQTGGKYQIVHSKIVALANQTTVMARTFDTGINLLSAVFSLTSNLQGDHITWMIAPHTTIGAVTVSTEVGSTVIKVQKSVIDNIEPLYRVRLALNTDQYNTYEDVGVVTEIDEVNSTITVTSPCTQIWSAGTTLVKMTIVMIDIEAGFLNLDLKIGQDKIGASYVPKGVPIVCEYTNNHLTDDHIFYAYYSYLYGRPRLQ
jgi:hypothetical protein